MASGYSTGQLKTSQRTQQKCEKQKMMGVGMGCSPHLSTAEALGVRGMHSKPVVRGKFQCSLLSCGSW